MATIFYLDSALAAGRFEGRTGVQEAQSLASLARAGKGRPPVAVHGNGYDIVSDRVNIAAAAPLRHEAAALRRSGQNISEAASLLQVADSGLSKIETAVKAMESLAKDAGAKAISEYDFALFDGDFQRHKASIDQIAADTTFSGAAPLSGGSGAGGAYQVDIRVGTATEPEDTISLQIAIATASGLAPGLATAHLEDSAGVQAATATVASALGTLGTIRGQVNGDIERLRVAYAVTADGAAGAEESLARRVSPDLTLDIAYMVADQIIDESGIRLMAGAEQQLTSLLGSLPSAAAQPPVAAQSTYQDLPAPSAPDRPRPAPPDTPRSDPPDLIA